MACWPNLSQASVEASTRTSYGEPSPDQSADSEQTCMHQLRTNRVKPRNDNQLTRRFLMHSDKRDATHLGLLTVNATDHCSKGIELNENIILACEASNYC